MYSVFGGLTMAAPVGHLTIKFNSIKFNSLGLLFTKTTRFECKNIRNGQSCCRGKYPTMKSKSASRWILTKSPHCDGINLQSWIIDHRWSMVEYSESRRVGQGQSYCSECMIPRKLLFSLFKLSWDIVSWECWHFLTFACYSFTLFISLLMNI